MNLHPCLSVPNRWLKICLVLSALLPSIASAADPADVFGVAHVDGKYFLTNEDYLDEGADQVLATGSRTIKLYLNATATKRYSWNSKWPSEFKNLTEIAQSPYFKSVFAKPFHTYILTAYSLGRDDHYWNQGITDDQKTAETQQFYDLSKYLLTTYRGTGKTFILQHWEGDWALRDFGPEGHRHTYEKPFVPPKQAIDGMIAWLNARQAGITRARSEIHDTNVHIMGACEVNRVEDAIDGKPAVANAVLPNTTVDLASYSCYNFLDTPERLTQAVDYIAAHLPTTAAFGQNPHSVYLGEYGYPENGDLGAAGVNARMNTAIQVTNAKGLPYAIFWEIYCNELKKDAPAPPVNGKDDVVMGYWMVKPDGFPGMAWHRYRRLIITADPQRATADAVKKNLSLVFQDDFNRPDGGDLGPGWSQSAHYGIVNKVLKNNHLEFTIASGKDIPWGSATLDLTNKSILSRALNIGEYFEFTQKRDSDFGMLGVELFSSDQLRQGSGEKPGPSPMQVWNHITWVPLSIDDNGNPVKFDWNTPHTVGVRMDSADGHFATFSYYIDGNYAGSWLIKTGNKTLAKIGVFGQSKVDGAAFEYSNLKVYGVVPGH